MVLGLVLVLLGLIGGFFSGLLGLGGSILMVPLLLFVPPLLGFPALDMKQVSAISIVQVFFASISAVLIHRKNNAVSKPLVWYMGTASAVASLAGAWTSAYVSARFLLFLFAGISTVAATLMFLPKRETESDLPADDVPFNRTLAVLIALSVGTIGGLIGAPGAFIYVPLLIYVLGIPTRVTVGSTLAIVLLGSLTGVVGKMATGQVPLLLAAALVVGAIPGARLGGQLSKKVNVRVLRWMVTAIVVVSTAKIWLQALS
ncbi:MAG TPA: sulfite exporter TauE/SafE family protein [Symbiobacteriaceae bacterium]|nr:sulfite exporter TauE/SafE family protein [Symbiobacteriaceae bacterium]